MLAYNYTKILSSSIKNGLDFEYFPLTRAFVSLCPKFEASKNLSQNLQFEFDHSRRTSIVDPNIKNFSANRGNLSEQHLLGVNTQNLLNFQLLKDSPFIEENIKKVKSKSFISDPSHSFYKNLDYNFMNRVNFIQKFNDLINDQEFCSNLAPLATQEFISRSYKFECKNNEPKEFFITELFSNTQAILNNHNKDNANGIALTKRLCMNCHDIDSFGPPVIPFDNPQALNMYLKMKKLNRQDFIKMFERRIDPHNDPEFRMPRNAPPLTENDRAILLNYIKNNL